MAGEEGLGRVDLALDDADGAVGGGDDVADAGTGVVGDLGAEPAGGDGLLPGDDPHGMAEQAPPGGQDVAGGAPLGVDMPGPGLAGQEADPGGQLRLVGQVDPLGGAEVDHAVVAGDEQGGVAGQALGDLVDQPVDVGQLQAPGLGPGPADVPGAVQVGMVEVDQAAPAPAETAQGPGGLVAEGVGAPVVAPAQGGPGEAGGGVLARPDQGDLDPVGGRGLEGGRLGLGPLGHDPVAQVPRAAEAVRGPAQAVERPVHPGQGDGVADQAVAARREPGADRGQAGRRGRREPGGHRPAPLGRGGQDGGGPAVGQQQLPAEAVGHQQAGPAQRLHPERVGEAGHVQGGQQRRHQVGQRGLAVAGERRRGRARLAGGRRSRGGHGRRVLDAQPGPPS